MVETMNISCDQFEISPKQEAFIRDFEWFVQVFGNLPVGIIGLLLNLVALVVLFTSSMRNNLFNRLLICLAITDTLFLSCEITEVFRHRYYYFIQQYIFVHFVYPFRSVCMCFSICITVALTFERHQAIQKPAEYRIRETKDMNKRMLCYVIPALTFSILYYLPKHFALYVTERTFPSICKNITTYQQSMETEEALQNLTRTVNCTTEYSIVPTNLRTHPNYILWYLNISNFLLTAVIPLAILTYLNYKIYRSLRAFLIRQPSMKSNVPKGKKYRQEMNDVQKTYILFSIVIIFTLCHSIRIILNVEEFLNLNRFKREIGHGCDVFGAWFKICLPLNQLFIIISSSANFFIYFFFDPGFQCVLRQSCIIKSVITRRGQSHSENVVRTPTLNASPSMNNAENIELLNVNIGNHM